MVILINTQTLEYPVDLKTFYSRFINISFAENFSNYELYGYSIVYDSEQPSPNILQKVEESDPIFNKNDLKWYKSWKLVDKYQDHYDTDGIFHTKSEYERQAIKQHKLDIKNQISAERYQKEISGYYDSQLDAIFDTSREAVLILQRLKMDGIADTINFKAKNKWVILNSDDVLRIYSEIAKYIQNCYDEEFNKHRGVDLNVALL